MSVLACNFLFLDMKPRSWALSKSQKPHNLTKFSKIPLQIFITAVCTSYFANSTLLCFVFCVLRFCVFNLWVQKSNFSLISDLSQLARYPQHPQHHNFVHIRYCLIHCNLMAPSCCIHPGYVV